MKLNELINAKRKEKERQQKIKTVKTAATTAAVGTVLGAIGALLFAPKSGKETRENIAEVSKKVNDELKTTVSRTKDVLSEKTKMGKENVVEAKDKIANYLADKRNKNVVESIDTKKIAEDVEEVSETSVQTETEA